MRVLIVSCVFLPEPVVSARTSAQIAEGLVQRGHDVRVITTFPSRPAGTPYPEYARRLFQRQKMEAGFELVRCFSFPSPRSRMLSRFLENVSFGVTAGLAALTAERPDVMYANSWPIIATGLLFLVARLRHIPLVVSVQDVYPESLIVQRRIGAGSWPARGMRWIDRTIARGCQAVIVISERFAQIYRNDRKVPTERVRVVPNWIDDRFITAAEHADGFRAERNIPAGAFLIVYGGNIGMAGGVETVIEAFRHLQDNGQVHLLVAGEGSNLAACRSLAREVSPGQISFHTPWPAEETSKVLGAADVLILPTRGSQSLVSMPSKLISYMLAARPIIALSLPQADLAEMVERSGCGWVVEPDRPDLLATKIKEAMASSSATLVQRGKAGREFALRQLAREECLPRVIEIVEEVAHHPLK